MSDKWIKKEEDFDLIGTVIFKSLFMSGDRDFFGYDEMIIDLDSLLSLVMKDDLPEEKSERKKLVNTITSNLAYFLELYITESKISIYYNLEKYTYFPSIYEDWCKDRMKRYKNENIRDFIDKFLISKLQKLAELKPNLDLVKCDDSPILDIWKKIDLHPDKKYIIFSRDPHYNCILSYHDISIYNGKYLIDRKLMLIEKDLPKIHYSFLPYYYLIRGMDRNEYKGIKGMGLKKVEALINTEYSLLMTQTHDVLTDINQYRKLFFLKEIEENPS